MHMPIYTHIRHIDTSIHTYAGIYYIRPGLLDDNKEKTIVYNGLNVPIVTLLL